MSDEESFVILGTSPSPSMATINSLSSAELSIATKEESAVLKETTNNICVDSQIMASSSSNVSQYSVLHNDDRLVNSAASENLENESESVAKEGLLSNGIDRCPTPTSIKQSAINSLGSSSEPSLAASFILGEVNSDVLKSSIYSQFPSMALSACADDVVKLQNLLSEYMELKKTLINTNMTMKQLYDQTQKWNIGIKTMKEEHQLEIARLRNENLELRRDLESRMEQVQINEAINSKDNELCIQSLSEKTAQLQNLSAQVRKLEEKQLASFEFIPKNGSAAKQPKDDPEYVSILEHQRIVKQFETQLSELVAQNLEIKDMQAQYIDEINCLKVNLVAAEELQKKSQADIEFIKAHNLDKSEILAKFEKERKDLQIEVELLRHQVDIYSRDFKIEHEAHENLANEKGQLLTDLRELQRKNQELIQEAQKNYEEHAKQMAATGAFPKPGISKAIPITCSASPNSSQLQFSCPLCGRFFNTLHDVQIHSNQCIDWN